MIDAVEGFLNITENPSNFSFPVQSMYDSLYMYCIICKLQCIDEPSRTSFVKIL
jgi:hypothetical protein